MTVFEAPRPPAPVKLVSGQGANIKFSGEVSEHEEFKLKKKPAPVFHVEADGEDCRLTCSSSQLWATIVSAATAYAGRAPKDAWEAAQALGGIDMRLVAKGEGKERTYALDGPDPASRL